MNRYTRWAGLLALIPIAACSSSPAPIAATPPPLPPLAAADTNFIMAAAASDAAEIQAAHLAQDKARNPRIKAYAAKMITDHTAADQQLSTIAQAKGVTVNSTPSDAAQQTEAKLDADKPRMFDRDYVRDQVTDHKAAVDVFQTEIDSGQDPDLKAFAQSTLPTIKQHLTMAQRLGGHG